VKIDIHQQIFTWRRIVAERNALPFAKKQAMKMAGKLMASPKLFRAAVEAAGTGVEYLPRVMLYNRFNAWGKQREVPAPPEMTFRQWWLKRRGKAGQGDES
jgi:L-lactate dehydrogenase complex protein LldF